MHVAWRQTSDVFDDALKEGARLVLALGTTQSSTRVPGDQPDRREAAKLELHYQLVSNDGRVVRRAEDAPLQPFSPSFTKRKGYENVWVDGRAWRVYLLRAEGQEEGDRVQVQIGQPWDERLELLEDIAEDLAWPMLGLLLRNEVDRCTALTESLLALARLDPERPESLVKEPVDLDALFQRLVALRPGGTDSTLHVDAGGLTLQAHPALLESALRNLLDNAVRYGAAGGHVEITAKAGESIVRIAVRDDGPGVSEADRARLTERFFRVLGSGQTGSGLGLSIVARIAALHNAALRFEPGLDGRGLGVVMEFSVD